MQNGSGSQSDISVVLHMLYPCASTRSVHLITTGTFGVGVIVAALIIVGFIYMLFRPYKESNSLKTNISSVAAHK